MQSTTTTLIVQSIFIFDKTKYFILEKRFIAYDLEYCILARLVYTKLLKCNVKVHRRNKEVNVSFYYYLVRFVELTFFILFLNVRLTIYMP